MTFIVTTPNRVIEQEIMKAMAGITTKRIRNKLSTIKREIQAEAKDDLRSSRTYNELLAGDLRNHFGIPAGEESQRVNSIVDTICDNIEVIYVNSYFGGIRVGILQDGFKDILSLPASVIQAATGNLRWLDWLLLQGDNIIVSDFIIAKGNYPFSRSGDAIMIEKVGGFWKVPSSFSGTASDNWLIRVLSQLEPTIEKIFKRNLT
jgi:hypothetical protein